MPRRKTNVIIATKNSISKACWNYTLRKNMLRVWDWKNVIFVTFVINVTFSNTASQNVVTIIKNRKELLDVLKLVLSKVKHNLGPSYGKSSSRHK